MPQITENTLINIRVRPMLAVGRSELHSYQKVRHRN